MRRLLVTVAATAAIFGLGTATASAKTWGKKPATVVDLAVKASSTAGPDSNPYDYDLLIAALGATGLDQTLADPSGKFTVFAPNDRAFQRLVADLTGASALPSEADALNAVVATFTPEQISNILLYHVVAGKSLNPVQVLFAGELTMANGGTVKPRFIRLVDESPALRDPKLVLWAINLRAGNGVIHTIDRVLVPAS